MTDDQQQHDTEAENDDSTDRTMRSLLLETAGDSPASKVVKGSPCTTVATSASDSQCTSPANTRPGFFQSCLTCFWPRKGYRERPKQNCFVEANACNAAAGLNWHLSYPDTPVVRTASSFDFFEAPTVKKHDPPAATSSSLFVPISAIDNAGPPRIPSRCRSSTNETSKNNSRARRTPIGRASPSFTFNGATMTSANTAHTHRRREVSLSFFTAQTMDQIVSSPSSADQPRQNQVSTPRDDHENLEGSGENGAPAANRPIHRSAFRTPENNQARADSASFRDTIKVVTCKKRNTLFGDGSDVSPIDSDAGFSPLGELRNQRTRASKRSPKRLTFDGSARAAATETTGQPTLDGCDEEEGTSAAVPAFASSTSPLKELRLSVVKSLTQLLTQDDREERENETGVQKGSLLILRRAESSRSKNDERLWHETFLPKCPTFLKALRRAGRKGKVLIQGWCAFRDTASWDEIVAKPQRCDFRYVVLLDDMPLLHIFRTRRRNKDKGGLRRGVLMDSTSLKLADDYVIRVQSATNDLGNEVCIVDEETSDLQCSLLPIPMPQHLFLDRHKSRLVKGGALRRAFETTRRTDSHLQNTERVAIPLLLGQYDVTRHLLFVLDAAIKFPMPGSDRLC